jgi:hypothetical protein
MTVSACAVRPRLAQIASNAAIFFISHSRILLLPSQPKKLSIAPENSTALRNNGAETHKREMRWEISC